MLKFQKVILTGIAIGVLAAAGSGQTARAIPFPIAIAGDNTGAMNVNWTGIGGNLSINIPNGFILSKCGAPFNANVTINMPVIPAAGYNWQAGPQEFEQELAAGGTLTVTDNVTLQVYLSCNFGKAVIHGVNGSSSAGLTLELDSANYTNGPSAYFPTGVLAVPGSISIEFVTLNPIVAGAAGVNAFTANDGITFGVSPGPPPQVTGLTVTPGNAKNTLAWTGPPLGSGVKYNVLRSTTNGGPYTNISASQVPLNYTDLGLTNGTTYYYVVNAISFFGTGANSAQVSGTPFGPPAPPTGLAATAGNTQVVLTWTASAGATSYNVLRSLVNGGPYTSIATGILVTNYTNTGLTNGTTYYFVVTATNASGTSGNSNQASATPVPPIPAAPTGLSAATGPARATLNWTASAGATSYNVLRSTVSGSGYVSVATGVIPTSYINTGLTVGTTYYFVVTATNLGGTSGNSAQASATPYPLAPTSLAGVAGANKATLTWTASTGATSYNVYRSLVTSGPYTAIASGITAATYTNTGLTTGTTYFYVVTGIGAGGESGNSNQAAVTSL